MAQFARQYVFADGSRWTPIAAWQRLYLDAIADWPSVALVAPAQSGKSTVGHDIPTLYHLLEHGETVIAAAPDEKVCRDRWHAGIRPTLTDCGAFDGAFNPRMLVTPTDRPAAVLRYMTAGGGDKSRASFTSRVVALTEADGFDVVGGAASREGSKLDQLRARQRSYPSHLRRWYAECTASTEDGYIWRAVNGGTASRVAYPCECGAYVSPEREHLRGWQTAPSAREAQRAGHWVCPACGRAIDDTARHAMAAGAVLLHSGQCVTDGAVVGPVPDVDTFGLRVSAFDNLLLPTGDFAADEWRALRAPDPEAADRAMRQFVFGLPAKSDESDKHDIDIATRVSECGRRVVPNGATVYAGIDVGKRYVFYAMVAVCADGTRIVIDYDQLDIPTDRFGVDEGVTRGIVDCVAALREFSPRGIAVDSGAFTESVYAAARLCGREVIASKGLNSKQTPALRGALYRVAPLVGGALLEFDADRAKSTLRSGFTGPTGRPGAWLLYHAAASEHFRIERHINAERPVEEYASGIGMVIRWHAVRSDNHFLDALANALVASEWARSQGVAAPSMRPISMRW